MTQFREELGNLINIQSVRLTSSYRCWFVYVREKYCWLIRMNSAHVKGLASPARPSDQADSTYMYRFLQTKVHLNQRVRLGLFQLVSAYSLSQNTIESAKINRNKLVHSSLVYQPIELNTVSANQGTSSAICK